MKTMMAMLVLAAGTPLVAQLEDPVRLKADGEFIDTGEQIAHSGPLATDFDGDGKVDLLVGNFKGTIHVFKNVGTNTAPEYTDRGFVSAGGEPVRIHNW